MDNCYLDETMKLLDKNILEDLEKAKKEYENGNVMVAHDILTNITKSMRECTNVENNRLAKENSVPMYNGWYHIKDLKPNYNEPVMVVYERVTDGFRSYDYGICESRYILDYSKDDHFNVEDEFHIVRYWRPKVIFPYPNEIVKIELEDCKKYNMYPQRIIEHQKKCGIEVKRDK